MALYPFNEETHCNPDWLRKNFGLAYRFEALNTIRQLPSTPRLVYSYTLPSALGSATSFAITDLPARPTFSPHKRYFLKLLLTGGTVATYLNTLSLFLASPVAIKTIGNATGYLYLYTLSRTFNAELSQDNGSNVAIRNMVSFDGVTGGTFIPSSVGAADTSLRFAVQNATTITAITLKIYESDA